MKQVKSWNSKESFSQHFDIWCYDPIQLNILVINCNLWAVFVVSFGKFHRLPKEFKTGHVGPVVCQFDMPVVEKVEGCWLIHHIYK